MYPTWPGTTVSDTPALLSSEGGVVRGVAEWWLLWPDPTQASLEPLAPLPHPTPPPSLPPPQTKCT